MRIAPPPCYERLNERTKLQIRIDAQYFTEACKYSGDDAILKARTEICIYLNAMADCGVITDKEHSELYNAMTADGNEEYEKRIHQS